MLKQLPLSAYQRSYPGFALLVTTPPARADLSGSRCQAYAVSLRKAAFQSLVLGGLTLPLMLRLPQVGPRRRRHLHADLTDSRLP